MGDLKLPGAPTAGADKPAAIADCTTNDSQTFSFALDTTFSPIDNSPAPPGVTTCRPDFQGVGVRVANSATFFGAPAFTDGSKLAGVDSKNAMQILFERSNDRYFAKSLNGTNLSVDAASGELTLNPSNPNQSSFNPTQFYLIECVSGCKPGLTLGSGGFIGDGCRIRSASNDKLCVQVGNREGPGQDGDRIVLRPCANFQSQRWNLITSAFRPDPPAASSPSWPHQSATPSAPSWPHQSAKPSAPSWPHQSGSPTLPGAAPSASVCNPNFENVGVRVANSATNWGARRFVTNEDLVTDGVFDTRLEVVFQQTGFPAVSYVAKSLNGTNLIVGARANGLLYLLTESAESSARQRWLIECIGGCPGGNRAAGGGLAADNCRIKFQATGQCVQISSRNPGDTITLQSCNGQDNQRFNFQTSPFTARISDGPETLASSAKPKAHLSDTDLGDLSIGDLKKLMANGYIVIGLLAGVLLALVALAVILLSRGCLKGRAGRGKPKYSTVARGDIEVFDTQKRYSD
ncbi:hypothetical protein HGRIS_008607 [Hohenbuehelia grisea]|uniref:Ricin B lectin domain-containing protein n=1 Tax=Hohenbuehelia grisea TaxID=104357 RepID=A0ABR3J9J4_9AGAR